MSEPAARQGSDAAVPLPTVVIGGYLGAGKTTLINHLLREAGAGGAGGGRRIAVLVNDFGEINIDADLIEGADGEVLSLAGGCVCCSFGADLVGTLQRVVARQPRPDIVLIETSGVGLPRAVASAAALASGITVEGIVVVADALAVREQAQARYVGDTVRQQLSEADLIVLAKADAVDPVALAEHRAWLAAQGFAAPCVPAAHGRVEPALVLGLHAGPSNDDEAMAAGHVPVKRDGWARPAAAGQHYESGTRHFDAPVDVTALGAALAAHGVLRAKGVLLDVGGRWLELQLVGRRVDLMPARRPPAPGALPSASGAAGRLVTITLRQR